MRGGFKPYPKYRDSGVPWLGEIPEHWDAKANRVLFEERKETTEKPAQMLSVTMSRGVIQQSDLIENSSKKDSSNEDKSRYKVVYPGDIAYNKMRMWQGAVGASRLHGIVSPAYIVVRPRGNLEPAYCHYLLKIPTYVKECHRYSYGICDDQLSLRFEDFKRIATPLPGIDEQQLIVRYLDRKTALIDRYIRQKKRMIALLEERKRVIIDEAVTGKIDVRTGKPYPKYKDSGVEWLGMIPEGWESESLRHLLSYGPKNGISTSVSGTDDAISISIAAIRNGKVNIAGNEKALPLPKALIPNYAIKKGDILLVRGNGSLDLVGKCGLVDNCPEGCVYPDILMRLRPNNKILDRFMVFSINSKYASDQVPLLAKTTNGTYKVSGATIVNLVLVFPPAIEQTELLARIEKKQRIIDNAVEKAWQAISYLQEYRNRLISDVVTGKLDVRAAAARLPEAKAPEPDVDDDDLDEELAEDETVDEEAEE